MTDKFKHSNLIPLWCHVSDEEAEELSEGLRDHDISPNEVQKKFQRWGAKRRFVQADSFIVVPLPWIVNARRSRARLLLEVCRYERSPTFLGLGRREPFRFTLARCNDKTIIEVREYLVGLIEVHRLHLSAKDNVAWFNYLDRMVALLPDRKAELGILAW